MRIDVKWEVSAAAVNRFQRFCIDHRWLAIEVPQQLDFGRDVLVDVAERRGDGEATLTGELFAAQVKGGNRYRRADGYVVPVGDHMHYWTNSSVPVIGIVWDPEDERCRWVNLTAYLREHGPVAQVPVATEATLDDEGQVAALLASIRAPAPLEGVLHGFGSLDQRDQVAAVRDCFAIGRSDAGVLIALRRIFLSLSPEAKRVALLALSHCTPHPDIFWNKKTNWIEPPIKNAVVAQFRWTSHEVATLLGLVDEFGRGSLGQCVFHVLVEDPGLLMTIREVLIAGAAEPQTLLNGLLVSLYLAEDPVFEFGVLLREAPHLENVPNLTDLRDHVREHGMVDLF